MEATLDSIHDRIMAHLFKESSIPPKKSEIESADDDTDSDSHKRPRYALCWLVAKIVEEYKENAAIEAQLKDSPRLREIFEEFIDLIETEYFESALFDTLDLSYQINIRSFIFHKLLPNEEPARPEGESLLNVLPEQPAKSGALFPDKTTKVPLVKVLTEIYVLESNHLIVGALKALDFTGLPDSTVTE